MDWRRGPALGRGSSATVYLATSLSSGHPFAVKSAELSSSALLQKEHALLSNLSSPYVVECLGFDVGTEICNPMFNLFMEYVPGGTLWDAIQSHGGRMEEGVIGVYARQILRGLEYLHGNGVAHCDVKSKNLLLGGDGLKIADLGCAKFVEGVAGNGLFSGTPAFMAPEVARGEEQGFEADVWAVGCTVIEMATGNHPWPEMDDPVTALYRIGFSGESPEVPRWLSEEAKDFVAKCLIKDPKERWTAQQLLEHPFLQVSDSESQNECSRKTMSSPSCVLDQRFWDSLEFAETPLNLTHQASSSSNSPAERIKGLTRHSSPDWDDQDWITVRNNDVSRRSRGTISMSSALSATADEEEEELENLNLEEDLMFLCLGEGAFSSVNTERGRLEMAFESDSVLETVEFQGVNELSSPLMEMDISCCLMIFFFFCCSFNPKKKKKNHFHYNFLSFQILGYGITFSHILTF